ETRGTQIRAGRRLVTFPFSIREGTMAIGATAPLPQLQSGFHLAFVLGESNARAPQSDGRNGQHDSARSLTATLATKARFLFHLHLQSPIWFATRQPWSHAPLFGELAAGFDLRAPEFDAFRTIHGSLLDDLRQQEVD